MSLTNLSDGVSVEQFFLEANWLGIKRISNLSSQELVVTEQEIFVPTLNFKLEQFFAHHNWQGAKKRIVNKSTVVGENLPDEIPFLSLSMKVGDFFQGMRWQGQKTSQSVQIAQSPKIAEVEGITPPAQDLNMSDLSSLF